jgi:hypothetical protein
VLAADLVRELRYDKDGCFWVDDSKGNNVVLLGNATKGTNRYGAKDAKDLEFVKAIIRRSPRRARSRASGPCATRSPSSGPAAAPSPGGRAVKRLAIAPVKSSADADFEEF